MKRIPFNKTFWTSEEIDFLIKNNDKYTFNEMALILNKSVRALKRKCYDELKLYKSKEASNEHRANADKKRGTDLSYEYVKNEASKYNTKVEFWQNSPNAYRKANLMGWADDICGHMVSKSFSLPQLILKSYLEQIFEEECLYNDRTVLKPYEIDCYFPKYKVGWEYNGFIYHKNNKNDMIKRNIANNLGIQIFYINEKKGVKKYEEFLKSELKKQIPIFNKILGAEKINEEYIDTLNSNVEYPNLLTLEEAKLVNGKNLSDIKLINERLYKRIIYYNLFSKYNIIDDRRKLHYFKTFDEYLEYIKNKNYKTFTEATSKEHIHRMCKKFNKDVNIIKKLYS